MDGCILTYEYEDTDTGTRGDEIIVLNCKNSFYYFVIANEYVELKYESEEISDKITIVDLKQWATKTENKTKANLYKINSILNEACYERYME